MSDVFYFEEIGLNFNGIRCGLFEGYATITAEGEVESIELHGYRYVSDGRYELVPGPWFHIKRNPVQFDDILASMIADRIESECADKIEEMTAEMAAARGVREYEAAE